MYNSNNIFGGTYQIIKEIGRGGAGVVYLGLHLRLQKYVVIKRIQVRFKDPAVFRVEADILKNLHHPNLPQIYDFIEEGGEVYTVMDYIDGRDFSQIGCGPGVISVEMAIKWFKQLMEVLQYMHSRQHPIIHSDIKPANVMLMSDGNICLIDFNISIEGDQQGMIMGYSDNFASPEQVRLAQEYQAGTASFRLDERTDIYSAAATMYYMMTGMLPNVTGQYPKLTEFTGLPYPPGFLAILDKCLVVDRNHRYSSAGKVLKALEDIKKQDIRYKRYLLLQGITWIGCSVLIASGVFCIVRGTQKNTEEKYRNAYSQFYNAASNKSNSDVISDGYELLNNPSYSGILKKNNADKAMILHAIGESYYDMGDYAGAADAYAAAVAVASADDINIGSYYLDYALALAYCGNYYEAESMMDKAGNAATQEMRLLLGARIAKQQGNRSACIQKIQSLLALPSSSSNCAQGCLLAAECYDTSSAECVEWLERAYTYESSTGTLRPLAAACMAVAGTQQDNNNRRAWLEKAENYYRKLVALPDAKEEDWLGLAITYYVMGSNESCINILSSYVSNGSSDYRVYLYMALACNSAGNKDAARSYCNMAKSIVNTMSEEERRNADSGMIQALNQLSSELGQ